jgi:hypothetical protein
MGDDLKAFAERRRARDMKKDLGTHDWELTGKKTKRVKAGNHYYYYVGIRCKTCGVECSAQIPWGREPTKDRWQKISPTFTSGGDIHQISKDCAIATVQLVHLA